MIMMTIDKNDIIRIIPIVTFCIGYFIAWLRYRN